MGTCPTGGFVMEATKLRNHKTPVFSPRLSGLLYKDPAIVDYTGYSVYDAFKHKIGYVSEVYVSQATNSPKYIYVDHIYRSTGNHCDFVYPCDEIRMVGNCRVYLNSTLDELEEFEIYQPEHTLSQDDDLIPIRQTPQSLEGENEPEFVNFYNQRNEIFPG
jgi:hypothetical protein